VRRIVMRFMSRKHWETVGVALVVVFAVSAATAPDALAQPGRVLSHQKISDTDGGFTGILDDYDYFGVSVVSLGDLDGDGVDDLGVGAVFDDDGGSNSCSRNLFVGRSLGGGPSPRQPGTSRSGPEPLVSGNATQTP